MSQKPDSNMYIPTSLTIY